MSEEIKEIRGVLGLDFFGLKIESPAFLKACDEHKEFLEHIHTLKRSDAHTVLCYKSLIDTAEAEDGEVHTSELEFLSLAYKRCNGYVPASDKTNEFNELKQAFEYLNEQGVLNVVWLCTVSL